MYRQCLRRGGQWAKTARRDLPAYTHLLRQMMSADVEGSGAAFFAPAGVDGGLVDVLPFASAPPSVCAFFLRAIVALTSAVMVRGPVVKAKKPSLTLARRHFHRPCVTPHLTPSGSSSQTRNDHLPINQTTLAIAFLEFSFLSSSPLLLSKSQPSICVAALTPRPRGEAPKLAGWSNAELPMTADIFNL